MFKKQNYRNYRVLFYIIMLLFIFVVFLYYTDFTNSQIINYYYATLGKNGTLDYNTESNPNFNLEIELNSTGFYRVNPNTILHKALDLTYNSSNEKWSNAPNLVPEDRYWNVADLFDANHGQPAAAPLENFTIVIVTYSRIDSMIANLKNLNGLSRLDKVVIIWNAPGLPAANISWPMIHVPVHVYLAELNSLNNRFLPFDIIETDAILSLDDDISLSHDEILFAFRVWREHQKRIVGFPGRGVKWEPKAKKWLYHPESCMVNFVLTGAAFIHKMYLYLYTYEMSPLIRAKVDALLNCEDIAMNFLVSNRTGKPPIKVTPKTDFSCPKCSKGEVSTALSRRQRHYDERSDCINYFTSIYGYIPLFSSETITVSYTTGGNKCHQELASKN